MSIIRKGILILTSILVLLCGGKTSAESYNVVPSMELRVAIPRVTLWSEPTNKSVPIKDENNKTVRLTVGTIVMEVADGFGRSDYRNYLHVSANGYEGYLPKKYLIWGYKIKLEGKTSQNIYRTEYLARNESEEIGSVSAYRKNEELLVIDETEYCLHVITIEDPESIEGYLPKWAYYSYVYE